jgi:hypothetical protein
LSAGAKKKAAKDPAFERCESCGRADATVSLCLDCYRFGCTRDKCRDQHSACSTPDELADPF